MIRKLIVYGALIASVAFPVYQARWGGKLTHWQKRLLLAAAGGLMLAATMGLMGSSLESFVYVNF